MKIIISFLFSFTLAFSCTTFLITKGATKDGSILIGHSDDNAMEDQRIIYIPAKDHPKGSKRAIYKPSSEPRLVAPERAKAYAGEKPSEILGYIDEVEHTYAYIDGTYSIMNEHQLAIGEDTNSTYFYQDPDPQTRIMSIQELSHIALERCTKAREAVILMGSLAEKYGYFDFGECLLVADPEEGWIFEITSTPEGKSAMWVAKKVPDGEVFVSANQFRIREVIANDPDMLYSSNLFSIAEKQKVWSSKSKEPLDWLRLVCPGEFDHPYYSLRRVWRVYDRINPSLKLSPWVEDAFTKAYPFSIKPEKKLSVQDAISLYRDHYENTQFDQTKGLAAGPYGLPYRYLGPYDTTDFPDKRTEPLEGAWERPISLYYVGFTYINQIRGSLPDPIGGVVWIGFDTPYTCCFMPLYAGINKLSDCFSYGSTRTYDENFIWRPFNILSNWISMMYDIALADLQAKQKELEDMEFSKQSEIEQQALDLYKTNPKKAQKFLTNYCKENAEKILKEWWNLTHTMMVKYNHGFIITPDKAEKVGYPKEWRDKVGYKDGPTTYTKKK